MDRIITPLQVGTFLRTLAITCLFFFLGYGLQPLNAQSLDLHDFQSDLAVSRLTNGTMDSLVIQMDIFWDDAPGFDLVMTQVDLNLLEPVPSGASITFLGGQSLGQNPSFNFSGSVSLPNASTFRLNLEPNEGPGLYGGGVRINALLLVPKSYPGGDSYHESMGGIIMVENMDFKRPEEELGYVSNTIAWPNPFTEQIQLRWKDHAEARVLIVDQMGRICFDSGEMIHLPARLDLGQFSRGRYVIQMIGESGDAHTMQIRKH